MLGKLWLKLGIILIVLAVGLILFINNSSSDIDTLKPFTSDGCSVFPDGNLEQNQLWLSCCIEHDYDYWHGGTYQQKLASDQRLASCVANLGQPEVASLMKLGVTLGGTPYFPTQFRWGYGWSYPRLYRPLSALELKQVQDQQIKLAEVTVH